MAHFWICHWQYCYWNSKVNSEGKPLYSSGSNSFLKREVSAGDVAYIVSLHDGQLFLGGRMTIKEILTRDQFARRRGNNSFHSAKEWIVSEPKSGTTINFHRKLDPALTRKINFISKSGIKAPCFISETKLDNQATRGIRKLTPESAALFDRIIETTDRFPIPEMIQTVSENMISSNHSEFSEEAFQTPDEIPAGIKYHEGEISQIQVNRYERDPRARKECIASHGSVCCICNFDFGKTYGKVAQDYIHVHHVQPLSKLARRKEVNPKKDMHPVCPNCHAVLHLGNRCRSIKEVRLLLKQQ